jgi:hypothetical protein
MRIGFIPRLTRNTPRLPLITGGIGAELGGRFYDEIERLIGEVCAAPRRFRRIDGDIRRHLANDFPFALLYLDEPDGVWIVAVMPLKREPGYWKQRLTG